MKKVLVTGAGGFIGSHLAELLVKEGYDVRCMVSYNSRGNRGWLETVSNDIQGSMDIVTGDVSDSDSCYSAVNGVEGIFHLAALIAIPYSFVAPSSYFSTNLNGTLNILQAARQCNVDKVICTSTSETYGSAQYVPIDEKHPLNAQSPYAASKVAADQLSLSFFHSFSSPISILRPFNTFGPRQSARAVIPTIISQIAYGNDEIRLGNLLPTRDFTYVSDTVNGFVQAMKASDNIGKIVNIGSNFEISIKDTVETIGSVMGVNVKLVQDKERIRPGSSEVDRLFADTKLATELINWNPKFSGLDGFRLGIKKTVDWFTRVENLQNYKANIYNL